MKYYFLFFLIIPTLFFSQKKASKSFEFFADKIEINAEGLDNITIENSESALIEIFLLNINSNSHDIHTNEKNETLTLSFENKMVVDKEEVFRKFITKRIDRASVLIKIPKGKTISIFGKTVGIVSKSYQGNLNIYIDKGNIYLNNVFANAEIKLFSGNVKATLDKQNIEVKSNKGTILIDKKSFSKKYKNDKKEPINFVVNSINANVVLTTQKTQ